MRQMASSKWNGLRAILYNASGFLQGIAAYWVLSDPVGKGPYGLGLVIVGTGITWVARYIVPENGNGKVA